MVPASMVVPYSVPGDIVLLGIQHAGPDHKWPWQLLPLPTAGAEVMCPTSWSDSTSVGKHFAKLKAWSLGSGDMPIDIAVSSIGRRRLSYLITPRQQLAITRPEYEHLCTRCEDWFDAENVRRLAGVRTVEGCRPHCTSHGMARQRDLVSPTEQQNPLFHRDPEGCVNDGKFMVWAGPVCHTADMDEHHDVNKRVKRR